MEFVRSLRQLWRHRYFRRLLAVRVATQSCDGVLQIALGVVRALLPRTPARRRLDRHRAGHHPAALLHPGAVRRHRARPAGRAGRSWSSSTLCRSGLALGLAALVATGLRTGGVEAIFYGGVLLAMSLNRFLLAALSASLPHTIDAERVHGGQRGGAHRRAGWGADRCWRGHQSAADRSGQVMPDYSANAILFVVAAAGFVLSASLALRIPRRQLGPDDVAAGPGPGHRRRAGRGAGPPAGAAPGRRSAC